MLSRWYVKIALVAERDGCMGPKRLRRMEEFEENRRLENGSLFLAAAGTENFSLYPRTPQAASTRAPLLSSESRILKSYATTALT